MIVSPLCNVTGILFTFCLGSHGQRLMAVGLPSRTTTHDHRKPRGDRGYPSRATKGEALLEFGHFSRERRWLDPDRSSFLGNEWANKRFVSSNHNHPAKRLFPRRGWIILAQGCTRDESLRVLPWGAIARKTPSLKGKHTGRGFCSSPLGMWMDSETLIQGNASRP